MVSNMVIQHGHLSTTDTGTNIAHTIVIADSGMLIIGISIASLSSIPHDGVGLLGIAADKRASSRSRNHLVAIETQYTKAAKGSQHLPVESATHTLGSILHHGNAILVSYSHNPVNLIRHTIQSHGNNRLRVLARLLLAVDDRLFQQVRIHVPCLGL